MIAMFLAALGLATGCEDTPLTAGEDYTLVLFASPTAVEIDPAADPPTKSVTLTATVLDATNVPQKGFLVFFSHDAPSGCELASDARGVETDSNGNATDRLTIGAGAPASIEVTAISSTLSGTVTIAKSVLGVNGPPVARIVMTPTAEQKTGASVTFDGSTSTDPNAGDVLTYDWTINSNNPDADKVNPLRPTEATPSYTFTNAQTLTVSLIVKDGQDATGSASLSYAIKTRVCSENPSPSAEFLVSNPDPGPANASRVVNPSSTSTDTAPGVIASYVWDCGNGTSGGSAAVGICNYTVGSATKTYTIKLIVRDDGFGGSGPTYECQKEASTTHTVTVALSSS